MIDATFKPFKVKIVDTMRFFEDDSTGLVIKRGQVIEVTNPRHLRSTELRFNMMRNRVLLVEGDVEFVFKGGVVRLSPGQHKNLVKVLKEPEDKAAILTASEPEEGEKLAAPPTPLSAPIGAPLVQAKPVKGKGKKTESSPNTEILKKRENEGTSTEESPEPLESR